MQELLLSPNEAFGLMVAFFEQMQMILGKGSSQVIEKMGDVVFYTAEDPAGVSNWKNSYIRVSHKPFCRKISLTSQEAFSVMVAYVALDSYALQGDHYELTTLLNDMLNHPETFKEEWLLWDDLSRNVRKNVLEEKVR